jgi:CxxC-x17-CxxC domain-containing protein
MEYVDRILKCADCAQDFVFTAGEQLFFNDKQFKNDPKRCKSCKSKRAGRGDRPGRTVRSETRTNCSQCGVETVVPFKPTQGRPVLCRQCFQGKAANNSAVSAAPPPPPAPTPAPAESESSLVARA